MLAIRSLFVEYYSKVLMKASAMHASQYPVSAMRIFDHEHMNIHEIVHWATKEPPTEALPFYSDIVWDGMSIFSGRLDILEREEFCEVRTAAQKM